MRQSPSKGYGSMRFASEALIERQDVGAPIHVPANNVVKTEKPQSRSRSEGLSAVAPAPTFSRPAMRKSVPVCWKQSIAVARYVARYLSSASRKNRSSLSIDEIARLKHE